jgi:hypothetical protein
MSRVKVRALDAESAGLSWRMRVTIVLAAAGIFFAVGAGSAAAHHGWTSYDSTTLLILTGTITEVEYANPHVMIVLEVPAEPEEDGSIEDPPEYLLVVLAPPSRSESRGMPREAVRPGATATVEGYLHRGNTLEMRAERMTIGDRSVELR